MPHSIECPSCHAPLNLPDQAIGRKLKCPKCGVKFQVGGGSAPRTTPSKSPSVKGKTETSGESTIELTKWRSGFDLPFVAELVPVAEDGHTHSAGGRGEADALSLFDSRPAAPRRKTGGDARAQARRCPTCGGVVPPGMSLCQTCGLDLETGMRVSLVDDLIPPPPPRPQGIPGPIAVVGFLCLGVSVICTLLIFLKSIDGNSLAIYFLPISVFGSFASIQFLRCKTAKLLLMALTLGAVVDVIGYIALPLYDAIDSDATVATTVIKPTVPSEDGSDAPANTEPAEESGRSVAERLDGQRLALGITLLLAYGVISIYTLSITVHRHMRR